MKSIFKKLAGFFGYEIRRKESETMFTIRQSFSQALQHLRRSGYKPGLIIDVGAADGTPPLQEVFPDSEFFWIEPLTEFEPALQKLSQQYNGDYTIQAIGSQEGTLTLNVHPDLHGSTLFHETDGEASDGVPRIIPVTTLDQLSKKYDWSVYDQILLKADVQGFEMEVIKGAGSLLHKVDVIILEVSLYRFLKQAPDFYDMIVFMKEIGFVVYDLVGGINRPLDLALGQKDIVFVKENGKFRTSHGWSKE